MYIYIYIYIKDILFCLAHYVTLQVYLKIRITFFFFFFFFLLLLLLLLLLNEINLIILYIHIYINFNKEYPTDCDLDEHNAKYCKAGYYLAKTNTKRLVDKTNNIAGDLYECIGSNTITCKKIPDNDIPIGYLINQDSRHNSFVPIITCSFRDQKRICYPIAITKSSCGKIASSKVATGGSIFKNNNKFDLCLDGSMTATKDVTTARYLMEATTNLGIESIYGNYIAASIDKVGNIKIDLASKL